MRILIFQSDKGDCLLLRSEAGINILVDGGMAASYSEHVAPYLGGMRRRDEQLDLVVVSHIDQDHISGILRLLDNEVDWRVYEFQRQQGNRRFRRPRAPRPPQVQAIWHNAFRDQVDLNHPDLDELLVASIRSSLLHEDLEDRAEALQNLVTSKREALLLSHRISASQLGIPINQPSDGGLMFVGGDDDVIQLGDLRITVIGPTREAMDELRRDWNDWLEDNQDAIRRIREQAREEAERLHSDEGATFQSALLNLANELAQSLGDRNKVSVPNLASLMLLVEEDNHRILLTGDGHGQDIIDGLKASGHLADGGTFHVDVLKVQHHGSKYNADAVFWRTVTADHYVFCGNGGHHNPHTEMVELLLQSRPDTGRTPRLWFNASSDVIDNTERARHMRKLERLMERADRQAPRRQNYRFLRRGSRLTLTL